MNRSPLLPFLTRMYGDAVVLSGYGAPTEDGDPTWERPAFFGSTRNRGPVVAAEYGHLTGDGVAIADRSWLGWITLTGRDRQSFLQGQVSNDIAGLSPGQGCRAAMLSSTGQIFADLAVFATAHCLFLTMDPACEPRVAATLEKFLIIEKVMIARTAPDSTGMISVWGGGSAAMLRDLLTGIELPPDPYGNAEGQYAGQPILVTRSGVRGPVRYGVHASLSVIEALWETLHDAGAHPVGEEALETVRVESADPAWGHELEPSILFPEVELAEAVSYNKGCYVGQEIVARIRARGHTNRALRGVFFEDGSHSLQPGDLLCAVDEDGPTDREIGRVTSVATSPQFGGKLLALAYVRKEHVAAGTEVICRYAHREAYGTVLVPPFDATNK